MHDAFIQQSHSGDGQRWQKVEILIKKRERKRRKINNKRLNNDRTSRLMNRWGKERQPSTGQVFRSVGLCVQRGAVKPKPPYTADTQNTKLNQK